MHLFSICNKSLVEDVKYLRHPDVTQPFHVFCDAIMTCISDTPALTVVVERSRFQVERNWLPLFVHEVLSAHLIPLS